jgi:RNA polymerase sigma-70 factor (ECF subfamily)
VEKATRVEGSTLALADVFAEHAHYVFRALLRLGVDQSDVEDVCQEVFLVVNRRLPDFEGRSNLRTWIYAICLRCASRHRKRPHLRREQFGLELIDVPVDPSQQRALEQKRALLQLDAVLAQLPDAQREVYVLYELEEQGIREIAEAVGCPVQTAYSRLHSARRAVLAAFDDALPNKRVV